MGETRFNAKVFINLISFFFSSFDSQLEFGNVLEKILITIEIALTSFQKLFLTPLSGKKILTTFTKVKTSQVLEMRVSSMLTAIAILCEETFQDSKIKITFRKKKYKKTAIVGLEKTIKNNNSDYLQENDSDVEHKKQKKLLNYFHPRTVCRNVLYNYVNNPAMFSFSFFFFFFTLLFSFTFPFKTILLGNFKL